MVKRRGPGYKAKIRHKIGKKGTLIHVRVLEPPPYHVGQVVKGEVRLHPNTPSPCSVKVLEIGEGALDGRIKVQVFTHGIWVSLGALGQNAPMFTIEGGQDPYETK